MSAMAGQCVCVRLDCAILKSGSAAVVLCATQGQNMWKLLGKRPNESRSNLQENTAWLDSNPGPELSNFHCLHSFTTGHTIDKYRWSRCHLREYMIKGLRVITTFKQSSLRLLSINSLMRLLRSVTTCVLNL